MSLRCEICGGALEVSRRQARRISGQGGGRCGPCRGRPEVIQATDTDHRFWLSLYGVNVPRGVPALEAVRASGLPPDLLELAQDFVRDC